MADGAYVHADELGSILALSIAAVEHQEGGAKADAGGAKSSQAAANGTAKAAKGGADTGGEAEGEVRARVSCRRSAALGAPGCTAD